MVRCNLNNLSVLESRGRLIKLRIVLQVSNGTAMEQEPGTLYAPVKPCLTDSHVISLCRRLYGIAPANLVQLDGYDDQNFWIKNACIIGTNKHLNEIWPDGYVFKITNSKDSENISLVDAQIRILLHLEKHSIPTSSPVKNVNGNYYSLERIEGDDNVHTKHAVRLLTFRKGEILHNVHVEEELATNLGAFLYELDVSLKSFEHPAFQDRDLLFILDKVPNLKHFMFVIKDQYKEDMVLDTLKRFEQEIVPNMEHLEKGIIHGDYNESNIVVCENDVCAILDFGDAHHGPYIFEIAIGLTYLLTLTGDYVLSMRFLNGYTEKRKLTELEERLITTCVRARLCQSLVLGLYAHSQNPNNQYLLRTQKRGWEILQTLCEQGDEFILKGYNRT